MILLINRPNVYWIMQNKDNNWNKKTLKEDHSLKIIYLIEKNKLVQTIM